MSRKSDVIEPGDILFAHKAITLIAGLSGDARRVAGAILDHFNKKTGQCDPSVERLAGLLGINRATVMKATAVLHEAGLIDRIRHGGNSHRTAYLPNWERFNSLVADWDAKMKGGGGSSDPCLSTGTPADPPAPKVAKRQLSQSPNDDLDSRQMATQTFLRNLSNKPIEVKRSRAREQKPETSPLEDTPQRLLRGRSQKAQRQISPPPRVVQTPSSRAVADDRALARFDADLRSLGVVAHAIAIEHMTEPMMRAATLAEVHRRGGGLRLVLDQIGPRLLSVADAGRPT